MIKKLIHMKQYINNARVLKSFEVETKDTGIFWGAWKHRSQMKWPKPETGGTTITLPVGVQSIYTTLYTFDRKRGPKMKQILPCDSHYYWVFSTKEEDILEGQAILYVDQLLRPQIGVSELHRNIGNWKIAANFESGRWRIKLNKLFNKLSSK